MNGFLLAFIATVLAGLGARDQMLVAGLSARLGQRFSLLLIGLASAALAAAGAVWLAGSFAPLLPPPARRMLAALALGLAALEMLLWRIRATPAEPTRSLGAAGLVLLGLQLTDAARFLLFAIVVASLLPGAAGLGGALGGMVVVGIGWAGGQALLDLPLARWRRWLGAALLLLAIGLGLFIRAGA
jgi:Ca2+/H+ antiporter, TMEM165/GDT1 family